LLYFFFNQISAALVSMRLFYKC